MSETRIAGFDGCGGWDQGDLRLVRRISLIPRCIDGCWSWMRKLYVVQEYRNFTAVMPGGPSYDSYKWINKGWSRERPEGSYFEELRSTNRREYVLNPHLP